ncbi:DUF4124 domain-containing protein [Vibrio sp. T187]|uniref:DUF4124 domain-containing protein n=1 Tax=Vibrio TaxID=662 RepID=UPI0010C9E91E|nr:MULTISPECIES: DUF4124 domain-containing protein [Vibrio]MBW3697662.1 DUF4124 domain-containing protein [Vibrio sp. T187]
MRNKLTLIVMALCLTLNTQAQTVYTWEDENGVLHFSDTPLESNAKKLILPDYKASAPAPKFENSTPVDTPKSTLRISPLHTKSVNEPSKPLALELTLQTPQHDQTLRSNQGLIDIQIATNRKLGIGEQLQLVLDGRRYGAPQIQFNWQLKNVDRGAHTISIQAHRSGKLIASSRPVTVYLHRATVK